MGEIDGAFRAWGFAKNGTGGVTAGDRALRAGAGRGNPHRRAGAAGHRQGRPRRRRRVGERRRIAREGGAVGGRSEAQLPAIRREQALSRTSSSQQIQNFRVRGSSGKVNIALSELARVHLLARREPAASRRDLDQPEHRLHRARLRRGQVRPVLEEPVYRHDHPLDDRPRHGAAGASRHVVLRAVRALRHRRRLGRCRSATRSAKP